MSGREENTELAAAVAEQGALPVPVGPSQALSAERLAELQAELVHVARLAGEARGWRLEDYQAVRGALHRARLLVADAERLRARVAELEAQRERRRVRLVALQNDALNMRGALSPMGEARKVPMPLGETLLPAVEWLIGRVAELEAERHVTNEALDDAVQGLRERDGRIAELEALTPAAIQTCRKCGAGYTLGEPCSTCMFRERMAAETSTRALRDDDELEARAGDAAMVCLECNAPVMWVDSANGGWWNHTGPVEDGHGIVPKPLLRPSVEVSADKLARLLAPTQASPEDPPVEDPHDSPLYHRYETCRDLPEGGAR